MKPVVILLTCLITFTAGEEPSERLPVLREQMVEDMAVYLPLAMLSLDEAKSPGLGKEELSEVINQSIEKGLKTIPNRFHLSAVEKSSIDEGKHVVTKQQFLESLTKLNQVDEGRASLTILKYYKELEDRGVINPAQRLLGFRLAVRMYENRVEWLERFKK